LETRNELYKKNGKLSQDKIDKLDAIGFVWEPLKTEWEKQFKALNAYKEKEGDCNVSSSYKLNFGQVQPLGENTQLPKPRVCN